MTTVPSLTTTFTPASSCTVDLYNLPFTGLQCVEGTVAVPCVFMHLGVDTSTSACFPPGWSDATSAFYSPGICPLGYTEACSQVVGTETRATCCPSYYACQTDTYWPWYVTDICSLSITTNQVFVYTTSVIGKGQVVSTETGQPGINAFGVRIRYASSDFASTASSTSSTAAPIENTKKPATGSTGTSAASTRTGAADNADGNNTDSTTKHGLSAGAKAGIGIGVALGVLALVGAGVFFFYRRRRAAAAGGVAGGPGPDGGAGANPETGFYAKVPQEADSSPAPTSTAHSAWTPPPEQQVAPQQMAYELPANYTPQQLPAHQYEYR